MTTHTDTPGAPQAISVPSGVRTLRQWQTLTSRGLLKVLRNGEFMFAFIAPAFLALCFYLPLRKVMDSAPGMDYGQFLMPIILLQAVSFAGTSAAMRSSFDVSRGINTRFRVLPMAGWVPLTARLATNVVLLCVSMLCGVVACLIIGWRPGGGIAGTIGLFAITLGIGVLLALVADGLGLVAGTPEATSQFLGLPTMVLGMVSTGFVPEERFPEWIRGFARNQPISQFVDVMRVADSSEPMTWSVAAPTVCWCAGLAALAGYLVVAGTRKARR
ncbi:ABC transporter permease [Gordonia humi]|uniref:ABC-2 type transport system permease protein n=1 Tax=Gordonia humi TaxID=686429 RepID=A0A840EZU6_9ACTN|nr:ABC transporter permease [Gordonia humi]MBB4135286.1 ABC-2 type transport system permease protein [Gordonia humi]